MKIDHLLYTILVFKIFCLLFSLLIFFVTITNCSQLKNDIFLVVLSNKLRGWSFFCIRSANANTFSPILSGCLNFLRKTLSFLILARSNLSGCCFTFTSL